MMLGGVRESRTLAECGDDEFEDGECDLVLNIVSVLVQNCSHPRHPLGELESNERESSEASDEHAPC